MMCREESSATLAARTATVVARQMSRHRRPLRRPLRRPILPSPPLPPACTAYTPLHQPISHTFRGSIAAALDSYSYYYGDPRFGTQVLELARELASAAARETRRSGRVMAERVDNVQFVRVPGCGTNVTLRYAVRARVHRPRFIGLNVRGPKGAVLLGGIEALDSGLQVTITMGDGTSTGEPLKSLPKAVVDSAITFVGRGVFAPQAWFPVPPQVGLSSSSARGRMTDQDPYYSDVQISVCSRLPPMRSFRDAGARVWPSTYESVAAVGGLVVLM